MAKNTSVALSEYFQTFIQAQVASGQYESASEVVRDGLRILDERQKRLSALRDALIEGENSGKPKKLNIEKFFRDAKARVKKRDRRNSSTGAARPG